MIFNIVKIGLKIICIALAVWLAFALVASTVPYISQKSVSESKKQEFDQTSYYGDGSAGPDRALVIETPADAMNVRLEMVRSAQTTLDIANHIIKDSETTQAFLGEIFAAADRGVKVRLLLDGKTTLFSGSVKDNLVALDAHPNIECRLYNPAGAFTPWRWHALLHDKFMVVDGKLLLLGGRNIDQRHFNPAGFEGSITHDRDVLVCQVFVDTAKNPSAAKQVTAYMDTLWEYELTRPISSKAMPEDEATGYWRSLLSARNGLKDTNPQFYQKTLEDYLANTVMTSRITLIHNPIEANAKEPWVAYQLAQLALAAEDTVLLQTPYATGNKTLLATLAQVCENAELTMVTNSPASSPNLPAYSNYYMLRQKFIETGAEIWEYQHTDSIHGKSLIIDGRLSAVGSFNMDDRSFYLDTETMLVIDSPQFAAQLGGVIEDIKAQSLQVDTNNTYLPSQNVRELEASTGKRLAMAIVYALLRPFQFLL